MENTNNEYVKQKKSWMQVIREIGNKILMIENVDGSCTFNGKRCLLVDSGGRILVVWL